MIITLEEVKGFLRLEEDYTNEDDLLNLLISTSEEYLKNATGIEFDTTNKLAKILCLTLITDWYENREMIGKTNDKLSITVESLITQLKYCYEKSSDIA